MQDELVTLKLMKSGKKGKHGENEDTGISVPESLFQRIKDYLHRKNMTQKHWVIGLDLPELDRDLAGESQKTGYGPR
ncbi:MAG: hypothetical protein ACLU38_14940 [Dysosmobacter sp.]